MRGLNLLRNSRAYESVRTLKSESAAASNNEEGTTTEEKREDSKAEEEEEKGPAKVKL